MDRRSFNRRVLLGGAAVATSLSVAPEAVSAAGPVKTAPAGGEVKRIKLYAEKLPDGQMGYGLEKGKASIPGPLIELNEGDTLHVEFENTMDVDVSLHVHGLDYEITSDGTKLNRSHVEPGGTRTYTWRTHAPGRRKDGTWRARAAPATGTTTTTSSAPCTAPAASATASTGRSSCAARTTSCPTPPTRSSSTT